jgi:prepilin-type N-terminal cleavage/methylation domain-containing protein
MNRQTLINKFKSLKTEDIKSIQDASLRDKALALKKKQGGFTLLELLVVVVIIAVLAGAVVGRFDGLTEQATEAQGAHTMQALDQTIRAFYSQRRAYPNNLDNLVATDGTAPAALGNLDDRALDALGVYDIENDAVGNAILESLEEVGITRVRQLSSAANGVLTTAIANDNSPIEVPSWVFNDEIAGGIDVAGDGATTLSVVANQALGSTFAANTTTDVLSVVANTGGAAACDIANFSGEPVNDGLVTQLAGLSNTHCQLVVALGVGNNSEVETLHGGVGATHVPTDSDVAPGRYARYIALFHVAEDADDDGFGAGDVFEEARFVGITDAKLEPYQDELTEGNGGG